MRMMWKFASLLLAVGAQPVVAQQGEADVMIVGQALDRCMATYAVRLTKTPASDEQIYAEATKGCAPLKAKFVEGIKISVPPREAADFLKEAEASQKPNFLSMVAKIRSDRAKRAGDPAVR